MASTDSAVADAAKRGLGNALRRRTGAPAKLPPGETSFSPARAIAFMRDPLTLLLDCCERYGPIFTLDLVAYNVVFMLGPEANQYITGAQSKNFSWGQSMLREFSIVGGEGLFLIDGEAHDRARRTIAPAFERSQLLRSIDVMIEETERALAELPVGAPVDLYTWSRRLTVQILMRALLGLDPGEDCERSREVARLLDEVERFFEKFIGRMLRGPFTPRARLMKANRRLEALISKEIASRRASGKRGPDVLSRLLDVECEGGRKMSEREILDHMVTLLFTGQDSTTSTIAFMFYEVARQPQIAAALRAEQQTQLQGQRPQPAHLHTAELPFLESVVDETLRRYAPPWMGPRRAIEAFDFGCYTIPAGTHVAYSMWATHHLPELYPEPFEFRPGRFAADQRAALPKGAFVPFGGGPRTCLGMRFAKAQIRTVATLMYSRFNLSLPADYHLQLRQVPTVSPRVGMPMILEHRSPSTSAAAGDGVEQGDG
ncbi:MAG: cytochrome P450 [Solirubrobacteraceae bacterium]